jgi:N-methylhydantoinase B
MGAVDWGGLFTVQSTEIVEQSYPLLVERCALATDSGGHGRRRGGLGLRRELRLLGDQATYSLLSDGAVLPAFGIEGGLAAAPVAAHLVREGRARHFATPGKVGGFPLRHDDVLVLQAAGGGGYGDPLQREPARVAEDVEEGYVSPAAALQVYGVVVLADGTVDAEATRRCREALAAGRRFLRIVPVAGHLYREGRVSRRRVCPLNGQDMAALGLAEDDIVELAGGHGAPLRAWCHSDAGVAPGTVPLDEFARSALGAGAGGGTIQVRPLRRLSAGPGARAV